MKAFLKIWLLLIVMVPLLAATQEKDPDRIIESIIESQLENIDEETDVAQIIEDLEGLSEKPININTTNAGELSRLYILSDVQINKLLKYIEDFGPAYSIYELNTIDGFTPDLLRKMEPFIWFGPPDEKKRKGNPFKYSKSQLLFRTTGVLQEARGYKPHDDGTTPYQGNRYRYYTHYKYEASDVLSAGFTAEKDPGEAFFRGPNKHGFDFYSAHVSVGLNSIIENVTAGDFLVRAGQGLVLWQGYTLGKSENVLLVSKTSQGTRPYTSVDENLFFRGMSATMRFGNARFIVFYSNKNDDGNLAETDSTGRFITSLQTSGYHRTISETGDKNAVRNVNYGGIFSCYFNNLKIGATLTGQHLNLPLIPANQLYNLFRFNGSDNITGGIDYNFNRGKYQLFGEAAMSKSTGKAFVQGVVIHLNDQLGFSALFRHFDCNYHALWANTFAEGGNTINETGIYFGIKVIPVKRVSISAYSDFYRSPWLKYSTVAPSEGWDILAQADFAVSQKTGFYIRYKKEEKSLKTVQDNRYLNLPVETQKMRFHFYHKPSEKITLKTRFEHVLYSGIKKENGFMVFQDLQYHPLKVPLKISARLAWFKTNSYNSRIFAYENDLLYTFSIPAFYGNGFRSYFNLNYKIAKNLDCWVKIANTHWTDRNTISSGYNEIKGNNKTEIKFQLRLKI